MYYSIYKNIYSKNSLYVKTKVSVLYKDKRIDANALWDTGATRTHISKRIVDTLNLVPKSKVKTISHHGEDVVDVYSVDIILPSKFTLFDISVLSGIYNRLSVDVIIGLDIISCGDFHMDYSNERPIFTFTHPNDCEEDIIIETELF